MLNSNQIPFSLTAETRRVWFAGEKMENNNAPKNPENKPTQEKLDPKYKPSGKIPPEAGPAAEAHEKKNPENVRTQRLTEALAKKTEDLSLQELRTLATNDVGREKMLTDASGFKFEQIKEQQEININLGGEAEMAIGAGDLLPSNVKKIRVIPGDKFKQRGERTGERQIKNRVGYFDAKGYIQVFSGDKIVIEELEKDAAKIKEQDKKETETHQGRLESFEKDQADASEILKKCGIPDLEKINGESGEQIKQAFQSLTGTEIYKIRSTIGTAKLKTIFQTAGLAGEKVNEDTLGREFMEELKRLCGETGLPEETVGKIMKIESNGNTFAVSPTGALGCMQLTSWVYLKINPPINPFDPKQAVKRAAEHLADLYKANGNDIQKAVEQYNGGTLGAQGRGADQNYFAKYLKAENALA